MDLIHITAAYSNAVLVAVLPHIADFAAKLDLPIQQPITASQVAWLHPSPYKDFIEAGITLTNHYWFAFGHRGYIDSFRAPTDWFFLQDFTDISKYLGDDHMTTNEAIVMARDALSKLGYKPEMTHSDKPPQVEGPFDIKSAHVPYCCVSWEWATTEDYGDINQIRVEINMNQKTLAGMSLIFSRTNQVPGTPITVDVVPELESDYRKRMKASGRMYINTNAPPRFPISQQPITN